jgi:hypothetical protein
LKEANDNIILSFKGRTVDYSQPVKLYRNLNKKGVWYSLVQNGKTVAHTSAVCLGESKFVVREATRQRVIRNKRKEFHAYIEGKIVSSICGTTAKRNDLPAVIVYNPFVHVGFTCPNLVSKPFIVKGARAVICNQDGVKAAYLTK